MKKRKFDLDKWEDWRDFQLGIIEKYIAENRIDYIDLKVVKKDGSAAYMSWFGPVEGLK